MPRITVDGVEYNTEDLSDNGKAQLASLQFIEIHMNRLRTEMDAMKTARNAYVLALREALQGVEPLPNSEDE